MIQTPGKYWGRANRFLKCGAGYEAKDNQLLFNHSSFFRQIIICIETVNKPSKKAKKKKNEMTDGVKNIKRRSKQKYMTENTFK